METLDRFHPDLKVIADTVEINSPTEYSLRGERRDYSSIPVKAASAPGEPRFDDPIFLPFLEGELYSQLYLRPTTSNSTATNLLAQRDFTSALSVANNGRGTWEPGWKIVSLEADGRIAVTKDQVTFWVTPAGLRTRTGLFRPGEFCRVRVGKELRQLIPGFYMAIGNGNEHENRDTNETLMRIYWNLTASIAPQYMTLMTTRLNDARIPFRTKVLADPGSYTRADGGVLYLEQRYFHSVRSIIREIHETLRAGLRPQTPLFTKPLAEGVGFAQDPGNGMSFGQSRCKICAHALWAGFVSGATEPEARLATLVNAFREQGLDPALPYLNRGARDVYTLDKDSTGTMQAQPLRSSRKSKKRQNAGASAENQV